MPLPPRWPCGESFYQRWLSRWRASIPTESARLRRTAHQSTNGGFGPRLCHCGDQTDWSEMPSPWPSRWWSIGAAGDHVGRLAHHPLVDVFQTGERSMVGIERHFGARVRTDDLPVQDRSNLPRRREKCFESREKGYLVNPVVYVCHRGSSALRPSSVSHLDFGDTPADRMPSRAPRSVSAAAAR
jgi:hypothetical protein